MINDFGKWLRKFRIDKGLLLKEMAEHLGVSSAFLSALERGKKHIPKNLIKKICEIYRINKTSLINAALYSRNKITVDLSILSSDDREQILNILLANPDYYVKNKYEEVMLKVD